MAKASSIDVKRLLELAERMGLPASEAIHQVRELSSDSDPEPVVIGPSSERPPNG